jgi:hypothetical protein
MCTMGRAGSPDAVPARLPVVTVGGDKTSSPRASLLLVFVDFLGCAPTLSLVLLSVQNKYDVEGIVGEGAYGVVLKCRNKVRCALCG